MGDLLETTGGVVVKGREPPERVGDLRDQQRVRSQMVGESRPLAESIREGHEPEARVVGEIDLIPLWIDGRGHEHSARGHHGAVGLGEDLLGTVREEPLVAYGAARYPSQDGPALE